jgi:23S rRNA pseudouridine1911/1915/1917 synthase
MMDSDLFFISEEDAGERLDKILAKRFAALGSRTYFQYLIAEGQVLLNGLPVKKRTVPNIGNEVEIHYAAHPEAQLEAENIPLDIVFEDESLLIVNKKAGMVVHPAAGNWTGTFVHALLYHCKENMPLMPGSLRPGIVHRLDKDTSGLLIAAKTVQAQQRLIEMFAARQIQKEYLAICLGNPGSGSVEAPIGRHPVNRQQMAVVEGGKSAVTHFQTVHYNAKMSLVRLQLETGRTHQIRVHLKHRQHAVLGDTLYGNAAFNAKYQAGRQMLHACQLKFIHPITHVPLELTAPIPDDMRRLLERENLLSVFQTPGAEFAQFQV